ncbi:hypothetical protein FRC01_001785 [Tulasnella sp. 417]|nr:hypothetical protein FRC01_001785 [Tulasnella sp. 417]
MASNTSAVVQPTLSLSSDQDAIVRRCADVVHNARRDGTAPRVHLFGDYVVKFNEKGIRNEADTQTFVYEALKSQPNAPRVPEVYDCFSWGGMQYLVMEQIECPTVEEWIKDAAGEAEALSRFEIACKAVANALRWLFALSPPAGADIGLIDGAYAQTQAPNVRENTGCARNTFFGRYPAPLRYSSPLALERHINAALGKRPRSADPLAVKLSSEPLSIVAGDIRQRNFLIDPKTLRVTIIDFGDICVLPLSFVSFTLHATQNTFITRIAENLAWAKSENLRAMGEATGIYWLKSCQGRSFGLDKDGLPLTKA